MQHISRKTSARSLASQAFNVRRSRRLLQLRVRKAPEHPLGCWPKSTAYCECIADSLACANSTLVELFVVAQHAKEVPSLTLSLTPSAALYTM